MRATAAFLVSAVRGFAVLSGSDRENETDNKEEPAVSTCHGGTPSWVHGEMPGGTLRGDETDGGLFHAREAARPGPVNAACAAAMSSAPGTP